MTLSLTGSAALIIADYGETVVVAGVSYTAAFVDGRTKPDEHAPAGSDSIKAASVYFLVADAPVIGVGTHVIRSVDGSEWEAVAVDTSYGMVVAQLQTVEHITRGKV